jgi:outer membrane lipoprotein SlyB
VRALAALLGFVVLTVWAQTCLVCGEIRSIREVNAAGLSQKPAPATPGSPQGLDTGPVVGTVAEFHFGGGARSGDWTFGAAGTPEMQARLGETTYEITVAMDIGEHRTLQRRDGNRFHVGQRVALRAGELEPM